jgi:hypothetical protein
MLFYFESLLLLNVSFFCYNREILYALKSFLFSYLKRPINIFMYNRYLSLLFFSLFICTSSTYDMYEYIFVSTLIVSLFSPLHTNSRLREPRISLYVELRNSPATSVNFALDRLPHCFIVVRCGANWGVTHNFEEHGRKVAFYYLFFCILLSPERVFRFNLHVGFFSHFHSPHVYTRVYDTLWRDYLR